MSRRRSQRKSAASADYLSDDDNPATAAAPTGSAAPTPAIAAGSLLAYFVLARPKFLYYSLACHLAGILLARVQGRPIDWGTAALAQLTVWCVHVAAHFFNEYGDVNADRHNANAGSWTGGSKILKAGLLPPVAALRLGVAALVLAFVGGAAVVLRLARRDGGVDVHWPTSASDTVSLAAAVFRAIPLEYVLLGVSVMAVTVAYSIKPFRLSAHALGEVCVAYVLTFALPLTGLYSQGGHLDFHAVTALLPACVINLNRMMVMNIPDRDGDAADSKNTSVVLVGEERAVMVTNVVTLATYCALVPQLGLSRAVCVGYLLPLPLRWWQTLRLNIPRWWTQKALVDSIPFVESMFVLTTILALDLGLWCEGTEECRRLLG